MRTQLVASNQTVVDGIHRFQYIDILRGMAILGVIAVHSEQQIENLYPLVRSIFNYGQLGVQLFFLASALTLCFSMSERNEKNKFNFYLRRFFRIAPLYYLGIIFYFFWRVLKNYIEIGSMMPLPEYTLFGIIENIFFIHGFDPKNFNFVVPGGWSIATEMYFYAMFPLLFSIQSKLGYKDFLRFSIKIIVLSFLIQIVIINVIEPKLIDYGFLKSKIVNDEFGFIYCTILNQISVFLIGILTYQRLQNQSASIHTLFFAFILCCISCYLLNTSNFKTGYNGFVYPILSSIAYSIVASRLSKSGHIKGLTAEALAKIGQVSFSIYLIHFFILDLLKIIYRRTTFLSFTNPEIELLILFTTLIAISYVIARFLNAFVEKPVINYGKKFISRKEILKPIAK